MIRIFGNRDVAGAAPVGAKDVRLARETSSAIAGVLRAAERIRRLAPNRGIRNARHLHSGHALKHQRGEGVTHFSGEDGFPDALRRDLGKDSMVDFIIVERL